MSTPIDLSFPGRYRFKVLDELPGGEAARRHFFPGDQRGGQDGLLVRVEPEADEPWLGTFAFGNYGKSGVSRALGMPDPEKVCVVSRGAGYVVDVRRPGDWEEVKAIPVTDVRAIPSAGIVVFSDLTELVAYGAEGVRWRTRRLAWDGLKIVEVTERAILGEYWDMREDAVQRFEVNLVTGADQGGVED